MGMTRLFFYPCRVAELGKQTFTMFAFDLTCESLVVKGDLKKQLQ